MSLESVIRHGALPPILLVLLAAAALVPAHAQSVHPAPEAGLTVVLTTSKTVASTAPAGRRNTDNVLAASVTVRNRGKEPVRFESHPDPEGRPQIRFAILDSAGVEVWSAAGRPTRGTLRAIRRQRQADGDPGPSSLPSRTVWTSAVEVVFGPEELELPAGRYRIEATVGATPLAWAAAWFDLVEPDRPPEPNPPHDAPSRRVLEVLDLSAVLQTQPQQEPAIHVTARGMVPHPGYRNARLVRAVGPRGVLLLDLIVDSPPPGFFFPMVVAEVTTSATFSHAGETRVTVRGANNSRTVQIGDEAGVLDGTNAPLLIFQAR